MEIWVDADACPGVIREILFRAAERSGALTTFVANQFIKIPKSRYIKSLRVGSGFDVADDEIVSRIQAGDLVITSDIPLAAEVIAKDALALSFRGELYTAENVRSRLNMRDFMDTLRASGVNTGGQSALSHSDRQAFANQLDKILTRSAGKI